MDMWSVLVKIAVKYPRRQGARGRGGVEVAPPGGAGGLPLTGRTAGTHGPAAAERTLGPVEGHLPTRAMVDHRGQCLIPRTVGLQAHGTRYGGESEGVLP